MVQRRLEFGFVLLGFFFLSSLLLAWFLWGHALVFSQQPTLLLMVREERFPLYLGKIPFPVFLTAVSFFWLFAVNEFFGKASALLCALGGGIACLALWGVLSLLPWLPMVEFPSSVIFDASPLLFMAGGILLAGGISSVVYEGVRKLTHSRLCFFRMILASLPGFLFAAAMISFPHAWNEISQLVTAYAQLVALTLIFIPFFYTFRLFFVPLIGKKNFDELRAKFARKPIFKPAEKDFFEARAELLERRI
ncbi:MAG: hypothetical protein Q7T11_08700 [Deltaproteobacteria bacterium]|nr:hypothetical protein [Deltaproteobacteria bacterium]